MAQKLLNELGVRSFAQQQRCARVPEVVKAYVREVRFSQETSERWRMLDGLRDAPVSVVKTRPWSV